MVDTFQSNTARNWYLGQIRELIEFIESDEINPSNLCQFLSHKTLKVFSVQAIYIARLNSNGVLQMWADYGLSEERRNSWDDLTLKEELPVTDAINHDDIIFFSDYEEMWIQYPNLNGYPMAPGAESFAAIPVDVKGEPKAVIGIIFGTRIKQDRDMLMFLWTVGTVISLYLPKEFKRDSSSELRDQVYFTARQRAVLKLVAEGFTNAEIASDLGFSESTIRHETMRLYKALGASGRKEAVTIAVKAGLLN